MDTSIWIDHLRKPNLELAKLVDADCILMHPFVVGELAMGFLPARNDYIKRLEQLPKARLIPLADVLTLVDSMHLYGTGLGYVDAHLLASACSATDTKLWTTDIKLHRASSLLGCCKSQ